MDSEAPGAWGAVEWRYSEVERARREAADRIDPRGDPTGGVIVFRGGGSGPHSSEHETKLFNVCNDVESIAGFLF